MAVWGLDEASGGKKKLIGGGLSTTRGRVLYVAAFAGTLFGLMLRVVCFNVATLKKTKKKEKSLFYSGEWVVGVFFSFRRV